MARKVLLVDHETGFLRRMEETLHRASYAVETAADGAKALEMALVAKPDIVVSNYHLPVFSGERLRAFIRSNPTTCHVPFIFLIDPERGKDATMASIGADVFLVKPVKGEELLRRIEEAFVGRKAERKARDGEAGVEGNLRDVTLVDLVQIFSLNRRTGILTVEQDRQQGKVFFRGGEVVSCQLGEARGEKAFFRMLDWKEGVFHYSPDSYAISRDISRSSDALLMEGLRQLDEWPAMREQLPPAGSILTLIKEPEELPRDLRPVTQEVLLILEFYDRVGEIIDKCSYTDYEISKTLIGLIQKGIVEVARSPREEPKGGGPLLSADQLVKVCALLKRDEGSPLGFEAGKILLFADPPELVKTFLSHAGEVPEFHLSRDNFSNQEVLASSFGMLGALELSETARFVLFLLPCRTEALPVWKPFSEGAIGAILLKRKEEGDGRRAALARGFVGGKLALPFLELPLGPGEEVSPGAAFTRFFGLLLEDSAAPRTAEKV